MKTEKEQIKYFLGKVKKGLDEHGELSEMNRQFVETFSEEINRLSKKCFGEEFK